MTLSMEAEGIALPESAWAQEGLIPCLAEIATSAAHAGGDVPAPDPAESGLLQELSQPMEEGMMQQILQALAKSSQESQVPVAGVITMIVQIATMEGPLKLIGGPPSTCDLQTFNQHLNALANQINTLHDPKMLGEYLQSPAFTRAKYELFALQHMQLLVWLYRVQQGLAQGGAKQGAELQTFVTQIGHAARVLLFQPLLQHALQVIRYIQTLPTDEVGGSMRKAMQYPADTATDADRVEWLQLNLCAPAAPPSPPAPRAAVPLGDGGRPPRPRPPPGVPRAPLAPRPPSPLRPHPAAPSSRSTGCCSSRRCTRTRCATTRSTRRTTRRARRSSSRASSASRRSTPT